ncbi:uncharacterized protein LOC143282891 [Babylonia areolata]|uniref:uncharacterized protein LOC143282891 n=1 Tax=Babylonia areolata TaxID=304850 RepID=UPI003FD3C58B
MMADAQSWLLNNKVEDKVHPVTGATALHVAAAKGYIDVMNVLLQTGVDINARDADGWTPLHAAVHWGQTEACQILVDHMCDMELRDQVGYTVFDYADLADSDSEMPQLLEELKKKQIKRRRGDDSSKDIILTRENSSEQRSRVSEMSSDQTHNMTTRTAEKEEGVKLDAKLSSLSSLEDKDQHSKTSDTPSTQTAESTENKNKQSSLISQPQNSSTDHSTAMRSNEPWRHGSHTTESVSMEHDRTNRSDGTSLQRSATISGATVDSWIKRRREKMSSEHHLSNTSSLTTTSVTSNPSPSVLTTSASSTESNSGERNSWSEQSSYAPYRDYLTRSGYKPFYQRQQEINQQKELERAALNSRQVTRPPTSSSPIHSPSSSSPLPYAATTTTTTTTTSSVLSPPSSAISTTTTTIATTATATRTAVTTSAGTTTSSVFTRFYEPPKRDEEAETQRKVRARHERQTRRPTQGILSEDVQKADKIARQGDSSQKNAAEDTLSSNTSIRDSGQDITPVGNTPTTAPSSLPSSPSVSAGDQEGTSSSLSSLHRNWDHGEDEDSTTRTSLRSSSFRRPKEDKDSVTNGLLSSNVTSSYVPRDERNAYSFANIGSYSPSLTRTFSQHRRVRKDRIRSDRDRTTERIRVSTETKTSSSEPVDSTDSAAYTTSRWRSDIDRPLPDIKVDHVTEDLGKDEECQSEDRRNNEILETSRPSRGSSSDSPYSEYSRSTSSLDYKKKYEEEKEENGKLKKELEQCKRDLLEAKAELDRRMDPNSSTSDSTDRREMKALERKLTEYEDELQKLREEKGALIRVISKLSK